MENVMDDNQGHRERLRERFKQNFLEGFHDYEVLELILFYAYPRIDTKKKAKEVLNFFHNDLHQVFHATNAELQTSGLSENASVLIRIIRESFIYQQKKKIIGLDFIHSSQEVYDFFLYYFKAVKNEEFFVLYLNTANCIIQAESLFEGTKNESRVYIRTIIEKCIQYHATQIIVIHNHPSGNLKASDSDINITLKIKEAISYLEIKLLDHLIIGDNDFMSFKEQGYL